MKKLTLLLAISYQLLAISQRAEAQCTLQDSINSQCATCCNCKGTTHVYAYGGTPPYTYSWSNGRTYDTLMGLASGTYTATVWDSNGCMITDTVFVTSGPPVSGSQTNVLCHGESNGSASITVSGNYSYSWSPGGQTTSSINGLSAGTYSVLATNIDSATCSGSYHFIITQPDSLYMGYGILNDNTFIPCADTFCGLVVFSGIGGTPPYTYSGLSPTFPICTCYPVTGTVTDANGCSYTIPNVDGISFGLSIRAVVNNNVTCNGGNDGSATINLNTYCTILQNYSWSPGGGTNQTETNLSAGTYTVTVGGGCVVTAVIAITQPPAISLTADSLNAIGVNCNGSAWATVNGGVAPYTYSWSPGGLTTDTITNQCVGDYCCIVTDANGCIDSVCTNIETSTGTNEVKGEREKVKVYPNPNEGVFQLEIRNYELGMKYQVDVYNELGQQMLPQFLISNSSFLIDISSQPEGVYFYRVLKDDGSFIGEGKLIIDK